MKERDELELILTLIGKYSLPLSPILEYAIKEKIEEFGSGEADYTESKAEEVDTEVAPVRIEAEEHESHADEDDDESLQEEQDRRSSSRYVIRVQYPDGRTFSSNLVWETLADVVNYAGPERVRRLNITNLGDNLISSRLNDNPTYRKGQKSIGRGLYISTLSSTDAKYRQIKRISEELGLGVKVEKFYIDEPRDSQDEAYRQTNKVSKPTDRKRDKTKYSFVGGNNLNKRRFVLEVVKHYIRTHPGVAYETLLRIFPDSLHPHRAFGVIKRYTDVQRQIATHPDVRSRFFLKADEIIELANGMKIVVHNQWGESIDKFLEVARRFYEIRVSNDDDNLQDEPSGKASIESASASAQNVADQRIGYVVRLFPSQQVGVIVGAKTNEKGVKKLFVRSDEGNTIVIDDLPFLYEVLRRGTEHETEDNKKVKSNNNVADDNHETESSIIATGTTEDRAAAPTVETEGEGDLEVEHVYLDSHGKVVRKETTMMAYTTGPTEREEDFEIKNSFTQCYILRKNGEKIFADDGQLKRMHGKLYRLNLKAGCFTVKDMRFDGEAWIKGIKKIVAYPKTKLYGVIDAAIDYSAEVEDIVDAPTFEDCKLKVNGDWYDYQGNLITDSPKRDDAVEEQPKQSHDYLRIVKHPLYAVRKQAVLRAMGYFRLPAKLRDISRTISRTAWGARIREEDVEDIISTMPEVEPAEGGKYLLKGRR